LSAAARLRLDGDALVANWRWLKAQSGGAACGAAVKADGYGLGAREVVARLAKAGCRDFFVATWDEAVALGDLPEGCALSVLHGVREEDMAVATAMKARPVLNTVAQVQRWRETRRPCDVMVDTGMNRLGLSAGDVRSGLLDGLAVHTLMSHLACADEPENPMNERQLSLFRSLRQDVAAERYSLANSAGICLAPKYAFGLTRPGLAIYGGLPVPGSTKQSENIRPIVTIEAQVLQVRHVKVGQSIGYGADYVADEDQRVAVINLGYADGYRRSLGAAGFARVSGRFCPVLGRVSMDLIAIGLPDAGRVKMIDLSLSGKSRVTCEDRPRVECREGDWIAVDYDLPTISAATGVSQYELLTGLGRRFERVWA
jgi:alanine racemase